MTLLDHLGVTGAWLGYLERHLKRVNATAERDELLAISALLAEVGSPSDQAACDVFEQIKVLFLTPMESPWARRHRKQPIALPSLRDALALLQPRSGSLAVVAAIFRCWRNVMGRQDPGHFKIGQVIEGMLQVPQPETYLQYCKTKGLEPLGVAFHPNVLARARKEPALRGLFGGSGEYWKDTAEQLKIVTD